VHVIIYSTSSSATPNPHRTDIQHTTRLTIEAQDRERHPVSLPGPPKRGVQRPK